MIDDDMGAQLFAEWVSSMLVGDGYLDSLRTKIENRLRLQHAERHGKLENARPKVDAAGLHNLSWITIDEMTSIFSAESAALNHAHLLYVLREPLPPFSFRGLPERRADCRSILPWRMLSSVHKRHHISCFPLRALKLLSSCKSLLPRQNRQS